MLAYYPFNGNANDLSGNNLNGSIQGGVNFTTDVSGKVNSAASFDGTSGYINVADNSNLLSPSSLTVSFLINLKTFSSRNVMISKVNFADDLGFAYGLGTVYDNSYHFGFTINPSGADCSSSGYNTAPNTISDGNTISPNTWYHVVAVFSDSIQKIYVNGSLRSSASKNYASVNQCSNDKTFLIGAWWQGDIIYLNGSMDEIRVYNRELNQDEINELAKPVK